MPEPKVKAGTVKVAFVTEDGETISDHFGRASQYVVHTLVDGMSQGSETRAKPHHGEEGKPASTHESMFAPISDCQVLIAGGMGTPALESARSAGLDVILAGGSIQAALQGYRQGALQSDPRRVHAHHHR